MRRAIDDCGVNRTIERAVVVFICSQKGSATSVSQNKGDSNGIEPIFGHTK